MELLLTLFAGFLERVPRLRSIVRRSRWLVVSAPSLSYRLAHGRRSISGGFLGGKRADLDIFVRL